MNHSIMMEMATMERVADLCDECRTQWANDVPVQEWERLLEKYDITDWSLIPAEGLKKLEQVSIYW